MEALILDRDFQTLAVLDAFESFIWTVRYNTYGDFELYAPTQNQPLEHIKLDNYVYIKDSDRVMILEDVLNSNDPETGSHLSLTGRSLESILTRRVIWAETIFENTPVQDAIEQLLNENFINCSDQNRIIPHFRFQKNISLSERVTSSTYGLNSYYWGENVYDSIVEICKAYDLGFRITIHEVNASTPYMEMVFELYEGVDHSYEQEENPHVVFSPKYENLFGSQYYKSKQDFHNAAIVIGSDADDRDTEWRESYYNTLYTGLDRREIFVDGSSIQYPVGEVSDEQKAYWKDYYESYGKRQDPQWSDERVESAYNKKIEELIAADLASKMPAYLEQLTEEGRLALADTLPVEAFDGDVDATIQYVYKKDFDLGDVVQVANEYGMEATARITEVVMSHDITGVHVTPTFTNTLDDY